MPYHVKLKLLGTTLSLTATSSTEVQAASYSDGSFLLAGPHTLLLREQGRRDAEIGSFSIAVPEAPPPDPGAWVLPVEGALPAAVTTVTAADDAQLTSRIAAATAGTRIVLTGSSYGPRTISRQIGDNDSNQRAVIVAGTHLAPKITGNWSIQASGWIIKGLDFLSGGGTRVKVDDLGVTKGYFRLTRCRLTIADAIGDGEAYAINSGWGNCWFGGGIDYCTIFGAKHSRCVYIRSRSERDLLIHHNHVAGYYGTKVDGKKNTAHAFYLGTEDESTGWRVARSLPAT